MKSTNKNTTSNRSLAIFSRFFSVTAYSITVDLFWFFEPSFYFSLSLWPSNKLSINIDHSKITQCHSHAVFLFLYSSLVQFSNGTTHKSHLMQNLKCSFVFRPITKKPTKFKSKSQQKTNNIAVFNKKKLSNLVTSQQYTDFICYYSLWFLCHECNLQLQLKLSPMPPMP